MKICFLLLLYIMWRCFYWGKVLPASGEFFWQRKYTQIPKRSLSNTFRVIK